MSASTKPCRLSASSDRRGEQEARHAPAEPGRECPRDEQPLERDHRERVRGTVAIAPHQLGASEGDDHHVGGPGDDEPEGARDAPMTASVIDAAGVVTSAILELS